MQLNIHDSTLKRIGFINNDLPDALHYFNDNWHRYLAEGTSTFDFSVNKVNPDYALLTLQSYISFSYDDEDYLFNIINIQQDHYSMQLQCENLNLELISEDVEPYNNNLRHSIVWYLKNAAKITDNVVEIGNNPFSTIDEDTSNPILSFDSTETKLARIISICNSFKAEFQFKTNLKDDGTLQNITLDLYQTGGVGQLRKDVTLYYGKNIDGITSTGDRTSTFFNSTTVTDSNNKYNWLSIEGKYYNSDGQLEFYKDAGSNTAYAPLSRDMFPSQILSTSSDQYTNKNIQTSASSNDDLWDYAVSQFKLYAYPQMTYEVIVSVNAVTSALGNDKKLNIGDTIIVQDSTFDKSDGGLILSARVSEQEISFTNPLNNKITFTNFVKLKSAISADLLNKMQEIAKQNAPYRSEIDTSNGVQFVNGVGSTTLTARIYLGADPNETIADSYQWYKDGTLVANAQEITVDASGISEKAVYTYQALINGNIVASQSVTITNVNDGTDGKTSYTHVAWANNITGTDGFTTVYPNLNLLKGSSAKTKTDFFKNFDKVENDYGEVTIKGTNTFVSKNLWDGFSIQPRDYKPNDKYTMSMDVMFTSWNLPAGTSITEFWIGQRYSNGGGINSWKAITRIELPRDPSKMLNQWIRLTQTSTIPPYEDPAVNTEALFMTKFTGASEGSFTVRVRKPKQEQGSTATPWMPSKSEVTTADWPSYIGQYSDFTSTASTDPAKYAPWTIFKGNDGKDGVNGKDGIAGKDGVGIQTTYITYAISTSGTIAPTTGWTSSVPSLVKGQYLWTKTVWSYTDNSSETGYSVTYISKDGNNGKDGIAGKDGVGIKTTTITYAGSTSGTTAPTSGWTTTVPIVAAGSYLWTKTVWAYTDNTTETGYSVAKMGNDGATGPAGPPGSTGAPGKIVSNTEPTTKFKGLTWKYIGITAIDASDGTNIQPNTEYYWNSNNWVINLINAQNIITNTLTAIGDVTAGSLTLIEGDTGISVKDGTIKSWGVSKKLDPSITGGYSNTSVGATLDSGNLNFYSENYNTITNDGEVITSDKKAVSFRVNNNNNQSNSVTLILESAKPNFELLIVGQTVLQGNVTVVGAISQSSKTTSVTIGAGLTLSLERRGEMVTAILIGTINSSLTSSQQFGVGKIPLGYRPNKTVNIPAHMTSSYNNAHIDAGIDGTCTWWGPATSSGYPRGSQTWFTDDALPN